MQQERSPQQEALTLQLEQPPLTTAHSPCLLQLEKAHAAMKTQHSQKEYKCFKNVPCHSEKKKKVIQLNCSQGVSAISLALISLRSTISDLVFLKCLIAFPKIFIVGTRKATDANVISVSLRIFSKKTDHRRQYTWSPFPMPSFSIKLSLSKSNFFPDLCILLWKRSCQPKLS